MVDECQPCVLPARSFCFRRLAFVLPAILACLSGCWSFDPGSGQIPRAVPQTTFGDDAWPSRDPAAVADLLARTPDVIRLYRPVDGIAQSELSEAELDLMDTGATRITYKGIHGRGLLRITEPLNPKPDPDDDDAMTLGRLFNFMLTGFDPNAYWMTSKTLEGIEDSARRSSLFRGDPEQPGAIALPASDTPKPKIMVDPSVEALALGSGMSIRFPPLATEANPYRGVILHLNAMFGNEYEVNTLDEFRRRGWGIIDLKPVSQVTSPIPESWITLARDAMKKRQELAAQIYTQITGSPRFAPETTDEYNRVAAKYKEHPLSEEVARLDRLIVRCRSGAFIVAGKQDYEPVARAIAEQIDQAQAGSAYAAEAVLEYVDAQRPDLAGLPIVLIGFSAGGLATPTTAARIHDRLSAVVIIGGGADCFTASQLSTFSKGGLVLRTKPEDPLDETELTGDQITAISKHYLKASRLDPYHTAPLLGSIPTLLVLGKTDSWVPAACGKLLWQRAGRPDRLSIDAGHELLFYFLPSKASFIAAWVESNIKPARKAG
ncbi:MAG: alpha/beta hydrolase [Phycisphaerales bacterium]|nr:alpha/beta hydrolase [Phycisphaerales bacterium]